MKRILACMMVLVMAASMLVGCGNVTIKQGSSVKKIVMWSNDQHDQAQYEEVIKKFNETVGKEQGIEVEYTVHGSDYYSVLDTAVTSGEGPDIFKCNKTGNYAEAGYLMGWEDEPALKPLLDRFNGFNAPGIGIFYDKTYSIPWKVTTYGLACNNEIFAANGLELPTTWDEMEEAAKIITENGNGTVYGYLLAMGYTSYHSFYITDPNAATTGVRPFDNGTGKYDYTQLAPFFTDHLQTFVNDGSMFPGFTSVDGDTARAQFAAGNVAMIGVMSSDVSTFKSTGQFPVNFEWTMIPYPSQQKDGYRLPQGVSTSYVISSQVKDGGYSDKVATFLNYLYNDELFLACSDNEKDISLLGAEITDQSTKTDVDPNWIRFSDMSQYYITYPNPEQYLTIEGDTPKDVYDKILSGVIAQEDVEAALQELTDKYNDALDAAVAEGKVVLENYIDENLASKIVK